LNDGDNAAVTAFASTWGALGYRSLVMRSQGISRPRRAQLLVEARGDPLEWVWAHAKGVRMCQELLLYLQDNDSDGLDRYLRSKRGKNGYPSITVGRRHIFELVEFHGTESPETIAHWLLGAIINPNLAGVRLSLSTEGLVRTPTQEFDALIDIVYWHLFGLAIQPAAGHGFGRCELCGSIFARTDPRQRFCPPPDAANRGASESRCAKRARARRLRASKGLLEDQSNG
jgi:hypothetical protein